MILAMCQAWNQTVGRILVRALFQLRSDCHS